MAELVLGGVGAVIGGQFGNPQLGFAIGASLGSMLFPPETPSIDSGRIKDLKVQGYTPGAPIPIVYGRGRVAGIVIASSELRETSRTTRRGGKGGPVVTEYLYAADLGVLVCEGPVTKVRRIWAEEKVIYDWRTGGAATVASFIDPNKLRIYLGNGRQTNNSINYGLANQLADSAIENIPGIGVGNSPAYRGRSYIVFENLQLAEVGNRIPNITVEVETASTQGGANWTLDLVAGDLCQRVGLVPAQYDFSALSGIVVKGFTIPARAEMRNALEVLARTYFFDPVEVDGKIKAVLRGGSSTFTIDKKWLGTGMETPADSAGVEATRKQEVELPRDVSITYYSEAQDFQQHTQVVQRLTRSSDNQQTLGLDMVLLEDEARQIAAKHLYEQWIGRDQFKIATPWRFLSLAPCDVGTLVTDWGTETVRLAKINSGVLGVLGLEFVSDEPSIYTQYLVGGSATGGSGSVPSAATPTFFVREYPGITDADSDQFLVYGVVARSGSGWAGGSIFAQPQAAFVDLDNQFGSLGARIMEFTSSSIMGFTQNDAQGILGNGPHGILDKTSTVRVILSAGTLSSISWSDLLAGMNLCVIGNEVCQFQTATLISGTTWELKNFLRGRRGTDIYLASHVANEPFALINGNFKKGISSPAYVFSTQASFRVIENNRDYSAGLPPFTNLLTIDSRSRKPFSPCHLSSDRDVGTSDVTLSWVRRVRKQGEWLDLTDAPLDESVEAYNVEIWHPTDATLLRTIYVEWAVSVVYSADDQTTDLGAPGPFRFRVCQVTTHYGLGNGQFSLLTSVP